MQCRLELAHFGPTAKETAMPLPKIKPVQLQANTTWKTANAEICAVVVDESSIKDGKLEDARLKEIDADLGGAIAELVALGEFKGSWQQSVISLTPAKGLAKMVLLVGAGTLKDQLPARARQVGLKICEQLLKTEAHKVCVLGSSILFNAKETQQQILIGLRQGAFKYPSMNPKPEAAEKVLRPIEVNLIGSLSTEELKKVNALNVAMEDCRLLQDGPPNVVTPKYVSEFVVEKAEKYGVKVEVMGAQKLRSMGFNALMAVAGGSANEPQLIVCDYTPAKYEKTIAFVGKGLTMDTGGYSLKPAGSQVGMKYDMSGSAVVLNSIMAIAELKLPVRVIAVGAMVENMVDAHAYRVGDVIKSLSGKTIEIFNTDAEGRVVLSDALYYTATTFKPDCIVEYSTLTGAMLVSLGHVGAGVFPFNNDKLAGIVQQASDKTGEKIWVLPTWEEYGDDVKGTMADVNNVQTTAGSAGSATAAQFLNEFVEGKPYIHIDIAGVADANQSIGYPRKTGSGYGIQLSVELAKMFGEGVSL
jgi:leucyl aminopeptidase